MNQNINEGLFLRKELFLEKLGDWYKYFEPILSSSEMYDIYQFLQKESKDGKIIYPFSSNTFKAFKKCKTSNLKLVIIGSDPYPGNYKYENTNLPHATGLSFDCSNSSLKKIQPSLEYFWEGVAADFDDSHKEYLTHDLNFLADQGVLLLNKSLTVQKDKIGSHGKLWIPFIKYFLETVMPLFNGVPILLLGKEAFKLESYIFFITNPCFKLEHPSYSARNGILWKTNKTFSKINKTLTLNNGENFKINWKYDRYYSSTGRSI